MLKSKIILVILLIAILASGCTPLFVKEDEPVIITEDTTNSNSEYTTQYDTELDVSIDDINSNVTSGIAWDISTDGNTLLVSDYAESLFVSDTSPQNEQFLNMGIYDFSTDQFNPLQRSNKNQTSGFFGNAKEGYIYLENMESDTTVDPRYRLVWSDLAGSVTKSISSSDESVSKSYSVVSDDLLIYGNQRGEITLVNTDSILTDEDISARSYQLSQRLAISQIDFWEEENMAVFGALDSENGTYNLYLVSLTKQDPDPILIQQNITHFELSQEEGKILYSVQGEREMERLVLYDLQDASHKVLENGYLGLFAFSPSGDKIIYSAHTNSTSNSQNLWIMDTETSEAIQMASNLNIYGFRIVFHPTKSAVYFTVFQITSDEQENQRIDFSVYSIDYTIQ